MYGTFLSERKNEKQLKASMLLWEQLLQNTGRNPIIVQNNFGKVQVQKIYVVSYIIIY